MHYQSPAVIAVAGGGWSGVALGLLLTPLLRLSRRLFRDRQSGGVAGGAALRRQSGARNITRGPMASR